MKLRELLQLLQGTQERIKSSVAFACGGVPRDRYLHSLDKIADLDITTGDKSVQFLADEYYIELAKQFNINKKVHEDGHTSVYVGNLKVDFSSNFNMPNIEKYIPSHIKNPTSLQKEMFSRDFTCNALLLSLDLKEMYDPTRSAFTDMDNKIIKTCLAPEITLLSNKNRVIRAIYLACKLNFDIDESIINFVKQNPESVKLSTPKSLNEKLTEAFKHNPDKAADLLTQMGLWSYIPINKNIYPYYMKVQNAK
jgi:poly(A) polymerase